MIPHRRYTVFAGQFLITSVPALLTTVLVFNTTTGKVRMRLLTETAAEVNEKIKLGFGY